jgi:hypothetical protein
MAGSTIVVIPSLAVVVPRRYAATGDTVPYCALRFNYRHKRIAELGGTPIVLACSAVRAGDRTVFRIGGRGSYGEKKNTRAAKA